MSTDDDEVNGEQQAVAQPTALSTGTSGKPSGTVDDSSGGTAQSRHSATHVTPIHAQRVDNAVDNPQEDPAAKDQGPDADLALDALRGARANAKPNVRRSSRASRQQNRRDNLAGRNGRNTPGYSGPGADPARDPHRLGALLGGFVEDQGWERPLAEARVFAEWSALVGDDIATHAHPQSLVTGELRIAAESTAWATQLRLLSSRILARLVAELGPDVVTKLHISGPSAPSWRHGGRSVRGHRGPRDTYG